MQLDIQIRDLRSTPSLQRYAENRLRNALRRFSERLGRVIVRISDLNGPRGGIDKRCHLMLALPGLPDIVIDDHGSNPYVAIDRAAERARRTLRRQLCRARRLPIRAPVRTLLQAPDEPAPDR